MAGTETRTLQIVSKVADGSSPTLLKISKAFDKMGTNAAKSVLGILNPLSKMNALLGVVTTYLSVRAIKSVIDYADKLGKTAKAIGVTTEALSGLNFAFEVNGLESGQAENALRRLATTAGQAATFGGKKLAPFTELGLTRGDLRGDPIELLAKIGDALGDIGSQSERIGLLARIFGEDLAPGINEFLSEGREGLRKALEEARKFGGIITKEQSDKAKEFNDALTRVATSIRSIVLDALPDLAKNFNQLAELIVKNREPLKTALTVILKFVQSVIDLGIRALAFFGNQLKGGILDPSEERRARNEIVNERLDEYVRNNPGSNRFDFAVMDKVGSQEITEEQLQARLAQRAARRGESLSRAFGGVPGAGGDAEGKSAKDLLMGLNTGLSEVIEKWTDFKAAGTQAVEQVGSALLDGVVSNLADMTISLDGSAQAWKNWGKSLLRTINEIIIRLLIMKAIEGVGGLFAGGGATTSTGAGGGGTSGQTIGASSGGSGGGLGGYAQGFGGGRLNLGGGGGTTVIYAMDAQSFAEFAGRNPGPFGTAIRDQVFRSNGLRRDLAQVR